MTSTRGSLVENRQRIVVLNHRAQHQTHNKEDGVSKAATAVKVVNEVVQGARLHAVQTEANFVKADSRVELEDKHQLKRVRSLDSRD